MFRSLFLALSIVGLAALALPAQAQEAPATFAKAKKFLADLHEEVGHLETVYCGCSYERTTTSGGKVDMESCGLEVRKESNRFRAERVEWEYVVPASWFGKTRACWVLKDAVYPQCESKSGRKCCESINDWFDEAHNDPNNLFPSSRLSGLLFFCGNFYSNQLLIWHEELSIF